ncbi:hypothetical protein [Nocardia sp. NBC_01009]|uniref:hypothetical protein n=1 Tax=Nocardia sp. NBC_01009 TaxID=2975996 RepID=UPI0038672E1F|nr:hypothetical protein OHA42_26815 [Nocardia sp. NBC_01009]
MPAIDEDAVDEQRHYVGGIEFGGNRDVFGEPAFRELTTGGTLGEVAISTSV